MTALQKTFAIFIFLTYIALAVVLVGFAFLWANPKTEDDYKTFGVLAGLALTADAAITGILGSFLTLSAQSKAAEKLAEKNEAILNRVEDHKKEILESLENRKNELQKEIERVKGDISRQNEFLSKSLDAKSTAYNKLFAATTTCYRELQNLARGEFDKTKVDATASLLREAEGLAANLDDQDREIVKRIVQSTFNMADEAGLLGTTGDQLKKGREAIWNKTAPELGKDIDKLRDGSPFYNQKIK